MGEVLADAMTGGMTIESVRSVTIRCELAVTTDDVVGRLARSAKCEMSVESKAKTTPSARSLRDKQGGGRVGNCCGGNNKDHGGPGASVSWRLASKTNSSKRASAAEEAISTISHRGAVTTAIEDTGSSPVKRYWFSAAAGGICC